MKNLFIVPVFILFSCNSFAAGTQPKKPQQGNAAIETTAKTDSATKKTARLPAVNLQPTLNVPVNVNQKIKKEPEEESTDFYGPLSWKPALLY